LSAKAREYSVASPKSSNEAPGPVELLDRVIPRLSPEILAGLASAYAAALDRANGLEVRTTLEELPVKAEYLTS
jgi:hypothetical protein